MNTTQAGFLRRFGPRGTRPGQQHRWVFLRMSLAPLLSVDTVDHLSGDKTGNGCGNMIVFRQVSRSIVGLCPMPPNHGGFIVDWLFVQVAVAEMWRLPGRMTDLFWSHQPVAALLSETGIFVRCSDVMRRFSGIRLKMPSTAPVICCPVASAIVSGAAAMWCLARLYERLVCFSSIPERRSSAPPR